MKHKVQNRLWYGVFKERDLLISCFFFLQLVDVEKWVCDSVFYSLDPKCFMLPLSLSCLFYIVCSWISNLLGSKREANTRPYKMWSFLYFHTKFHANAMTYPFKLDLRTLQYTLVVIVSQPWASLSSVITPFCYPPCLFQYRQHNHKMHDNY